MADKKLAKLAELADKRRQREIAEREFIEAWIARGNKLPKSYAVILTIGKKIANLEAKLEVLRDELEEAKSEDTRYRSELNGWLSARGLR